LKVTLEPAVVFVESPQLVTLERLLVDLSLDEKLKLVAKPVPEEGGLLGTVEILTMQGTLTAVQFPETLLAFISAASFGAI
jgi:hypothetical protein